MEKMKLLFTLFGFSFALQPMAQTKISGLVKDNRNKPLRGASISIKNSYDGAA
jgi:hypothetical protein